MLNILKCWKLTLKIVRLAIHEDVVDEYNAEDTGPQVQVTEQQHKSYILSNTEKVCVCDHTGKTDDANLYLTLGWRCLT